MKLTTDQWIRIVDIAFPILFTVYLIAIWLSTAHPCTRRRRVLYFP